MRSRTVLSWIGVLIAAFVPRIAHAAGCAVPSDCFAAGQVCHLGVCTPCESSFDDGGLSDPLIGCQDPTHPVCDIPDGSIGGQCVQCTKDTDCTAGDRCDQSTQTCVPADAGVVDASLDGAGDAQPSDAAADSSADAPPGDAGPGDASSAGDAAGGDASGDGGSPRDGGQDGSSEDGQAGDGASGDGAAGPDSGGGPADATVPGDASAEGGAGEGAYVEGDGCGCRMAGSQVWPGGAGLLLLAAAAGAAARRRSR